MREVKIKKTRKAARPAPAAAVAVVSPRADSGQVYDSIAAAAAGMQVSKSFLRLLKREGAPGFRGSRVYAKELAAYIQQRAPKAGESASKEELEKRDLLAKAEMRETRLAQLRGTLVERRILSDHLQRFGAEIKQLLREKENQFPALAAGLPADQVKALFVKVTDDILERFSGHFDNWTI